MLWKIWQEVRTRLRYKIIFPFLILTLIVMLVGSAAIIWSLAKGEQEKFDALLMETARVANLSVINQERANLQFLIEVVFAPANQTLDIPTPAVVDAIATDDMDSLQRALIPYFKQGMLRTTVKFDRLIAFNRTGDVLVDLERATHETNDFVINPRTNLLAMPTVQKILHAVEDQRGDKYATLQYLPTVSGTTEQYLFTIAPVRQGNTIVGGIIIAMYLERLAHELQVDSRADDVVIYDTTYQPIASTIPLQPYKTALNIDVNVVKKLQFSAEHTTATDEEQTLTKASNILHTVILDDVEYEFAYVPLNIRGETIGLLATGLNRDALHNSWAETQLPLFLVVVVLALGIIALGTISAKRITAPLDELVDVAGDVVAGQLERRSSVVSTDEIGVLATSFNHMTEHLVNMYAEVLARSSERAAIVESITDGIVMCDMYGTVNLINRATYHLLGTSTHQTLIGRFDDLPLVPITENIFGIQGDNLYTLGAYTVRVSEALVKTEKGAIIGSVYVLQDLTREVEMDRAKTGFIATISHELRTPLTSMRGNVDMLLHGLAGPLQEEQTTMLRETGDQVKSMSKLVANMITVAGLESGSTKVELEPVNIKQVIEKAVWPLRKKFKAKNIKLTTDIPADLPDVDADFIQIRNIMEQLMDNALVYTNTGGNVTVNGHMVDNNLVQIDVSDTGCGIDAELLERVFDRFVRGKDSESNDRPDRGIGLGLAIVKQIIELHGGKVWATSTLGVGSTFSFTLRCSHETTESEQETVSEAA